MNLVNLKDHSRQRSRTPFLRRTGSNQSRMFVSAIVELFSTTNAVCLTRAVPTPSNYIVRKVRRLWFPAAARALISLGYYWRHSLNGVVLLY